MIERRCVVDFLTAESEIINEHIIMQVENMIIQIPQCLIEINHNHQVIIMIVVVLQDISTVLKLVKEIEMSD
jgi:hypothetical protein